MPKKEIKQMHSQQPLVSGKWLLTALGVVIVAAVICAYGTLCLLFYQGSWQLIFHPSRVVSAYPNIPYQEIQFDYTETGQPQLTGWWIPAENGARYSADTIVFLHDGHGSLSDAKAQLELLHSLGINVFAFDYRGFGKSANMHPSEMTLNQDADAAFIYLTDTRHLPTHSVVFYGVGLGASIAASASARHPEAAALILENISPDALTLFSADSRTKILPVRLLTSDRFDPAPTLKTLRTPKLFLDRVGTSQTYTAFTSANQPKQFVQIAPGDKTKYIEGMQHFLDEVLLHQ